MGVMPTYPRTALLTHALIGLRGAKGRDRRNHRQDSSNAGWQGSYLAGANTRSSSPAQARKDESRGSGTNGSADETALGQSQAEWEEELKIE